MPASSILIQLSRDATVMSKAAEVPQSPRMSSGRVLELSCPYPQPTSRCADKPAPLKGAVNHIATCDTVVNQRVKCTVQSHRGQTTGFRSKFNDSSGYIIM